MSLWPFKPSTLLDAETTQWHADVVCWFLRNHGHALPRKPARLILPGKGFYRLTEAGGPALARQIFDQTKAFAGLDDWQYALVGEGVEALEADVDLEIVETIDEAEEGSDETPTVTYFTEWLRDPFLLISWFARALAREVVRATEEPPPCDEALYFAVADVVACLLGFGVFLADEAILGKSHGYETPDPNAALCEAEFLFDTALFLTVHGLPAEDAERFLKPGLAGSFKHALRDAEPFRRDMLAAQAKASSG